MTDVVWPEGKVSLARAAELFTAAGHKVDATNLRRFVISRDFPFVQDGRAKLVDAQALYERFVPDYSRRVMAGEAGADVDDAFYDQADPENPAADADADDESEPSSPDAGAGGLRSSSAGGAASARRDLDLVKTQTEQLKLAKALGQAVPLAEVEAAMASAFSEARAILDQKRADLVEELIAALDLPVERVPAIEKLLRARDMAALDLFADKQAQAAKAVNEPLSAARGRLNRLVAIADELRAAETA